MYTFEEIQNYHCPRWNEWPDLDLYMDQVISVLEQKVSIFYTDDQSKPVTSTMINNYVKQKIIIPSKNKKYQRDHLAYLYVIFLLKSVLSLNDIWKGITFLGKLHSVEKAYDIFCDEIETALKTAFSGKESKTRHDNIEGIEIIRSISLAFSYTQLARFYFAAEKSALTAENEKNQNKVNKKSD